MTPPSLAHQRAPQAPGSPDADVAWQPWQPADEAPWDRRRAAHLFRRAALAGKPQEIAQAIDTDPGAALDRLLQRPPEADEFDELMTDMAGAMVTRSDPTGAQAWWLYRMLYTPLPLQERLTLFWHNHFATSNEKVQDLHRMVRQNELLRRHALGNFRTLVAEISRDPAMLIWLDSNSNRAGQANENYARELMELFTLGVGNYSERDVQEAARAFTGWHVIGDEFFFNASAHDDGEKTVLGQTGPWNGDDVIRILFEQPACARFIVRKLFREFVSEDLDPPDDLLEPLADDFRRADYEIAPVVERILRSNLFFSDLAYRARIKSPVEYAVGLVRMLDGTVRTDELARALGPMGQSLFYPPNVGGWDGGREWINSATMLERQNLAQRLLAQPGDPPGLNLVILAREQALATPEEAVDFVLELLLESQLDPATRTRLLDQSRTLDFDTEHDDAAIRTNYATLAHLVCTLPEFQLA